MSMLQELAVLGADTQDGLNRFMNREALYVKMLRKFPKAAREQEVLEFFNSGDLQTALAHAHTLKGLTGNLALTPLYTAYTEIVALLRADDPIKAKTLLIRILPTQERIITCIEQAE